VAALAHKMGKITLIISAHLYIFQRQTQKEKKKPSNHIRFNHLNAQMSKEQLF